MLVSLTQQHPVFVVVWPGSLPLSMQPVTVEIRVLLPSPP